MNNKSTIALLLLLATPFPGHSWADEGPSREAKYAEQVASHYVELAFQRYDDSMDGARALLLAVNEFLNDPNQETHQSAKKAWLEAHSIYSHTEVFRFGNPNVDAWEGKVNAWPMDEGLIDYVSEDYVFHEGNIYARENIIANGKLPITDDLIAEYQSGTDPKSAPISAMTDVESNVTTGYHAIEFLLWGQDLNENPGDSGQRPHTDFLLGDKGTNGHTLRRRNYLSAATRLLIRDLRLMLSDWQPGNGLYTKSFQRLTTAEKLDRMILGLGSLGFAELATERIRVALTTYDQEEEQSCFSDTTMHAIFHNAKSIETLYLGTHKRKNGEKITGASLSNLVAKVDSDLDVRLKGQMEKTLQIANELLKRSASGMHFDQMIQPENEAERKQLKQLMGCLKAQTESFEEVRALIKELAKQ